MREYFIKTQRIGFSKWDEADLPLAALLWGDPDVTRYICASGSFTPADISARLETELKNGAQYGVQYWPVFELETGELIGCCGVRPFEGSVRCLELGFHLRKKYWGRGLASEAAKAAIAYSFETLKAEKLFAGHNPQNAASEKLLLKLGFKFIGKQYYPPTGLYHPSYELINESCEAVKP